MSKSADAFRTISEVAEELDLHKHVLRFWEVKFPQIKPMKRGGGRRYYRPSDLELLRGIRHLLHSEGYTIKGVQRIIREKGIDAVKRVMGEPTGELAERSAKAAIGASGVAGKPSGEGGPSRIIEAANGIVARSRAPDAAVRSRRAAVDGDASRKLGTTQRQTIAKAIAELRACREALIGDVVVSGQGAVVKAQRAG